MEDDREAACAAAAVPASLVPAVVGYAWARDRVGESGATIHRLHGRPGAPDLFLKQGRGATADMITEEMIRLRWLAAHLPVPGVEHFVRTPDAAWLLMTAMPGKTAARLLAANPDERPAIVDALAAFLRRLHAIPVEHCPFRGDHAYRLAQARGRIDAGLVDEGDFDAERKGWSAEQVWDALQRRLPLAPDRVVTHGDFSLDNLLVLDGQVVGCIDVGRVGIADRYQDLAILWNQLGAFDAPLRDRFLASYGVAELARDRLDFHLMLDELF